MANLIPLLSDNFTGRTPTFAPMVIWSSREGYGRHAGRWVPYLVSMNSGLRAKEVCCVCIRESD